MDLETGNWRSVTTAAKELVRRMLDVEPSKRPTAGQVLQHPWMTATSVANTRLVHEDPANLKVIKEMKADIKKVVYDYNV